jgi:transcriptional regulator with XRE-family HTH domain
MGALRFPGFGERLEQAMRAAGYVNDDGKIDVPGFIEQFGFDPRNFYPWLRGKRTPELPTLTRLAAILGVPRSWLLLGDGPEPAGLKPARRRRAPAPIAGGSGAPASAPVDPGPLAMGPEAPRASDKRHSLSRVLRFLQHLHRGWGVGTPATPLAYGH